ncbi:MAG: rod shape-determining protein MreD [Lachnospiraceae bacterium]|nr:rod shape-determining protein MreD [Lachnospiraceae bacterium]
MRRSLVNILLIILAFVLETSVFPFIPFLVVSPNLLLIVVFTIGYVYGEFEGAIYGILGGLLMDVFYSGPFGYFTLILGWIGFINGFSSRFYDDDYLFLPVFICAVNELLYNVLLFGVRFILRGKTDFGYYMKSIILPELMLTIILTIILYKPILALNSKLKKIDDSKKGVKLIE